MANAFSVQCPNCDARLKIQNPKAVGKKVRCPNCEEPFTVRPPRASAPQDDYDEYDDYEDDYGNEFDDYEDEYSEPPRRSAPRSRRPAASSRSSASQRSSRPSKGGKKKSKKKGGNNQLPLMIGGGVVAFLLLVGMGFLLYNIAGGGGSSVDFAWLPADSQVVMSMDVDEIWNSSVVQRMIKNNDANVKRELDQMQERLKEVGFAEGESLDAIDSVTLGFPEPGKDPFGVIRKKSAWNLDAIKEKERLQEQTHEGKTYYQFGGQDAVFFPDANTLIIGREELVKAAMTKGENTGVAEKFSFMPKGHLVMGFLPSNPEDLTRNMRQPPIPPGALVGDKEYIRDITDSMQKIKGGAFAVNFGSGMEFEVVGKCADSDVSSKLSNGLQTGLADLRKVIQEKKSENQAALANLPQEIRDGIDLAETVFNTLSASRSGDNVSITAELSSSVIDRAEALSKKAPGGGMPGGLPGFDLGKLMGNFGRGFGGGGGGNPIFQAREAAQRSQDKNNLKQIGIAMHNYHDTYRTFPPAKDSRNPQQGSQLSWRVHLLPFLEHAALYNQFHLNEPWNSPHNMSLINQMPDVYKRPGSNAAPGKTCYVGISGPGGVMENGGGMGLRNITDGSSNTIMVTQVQDHAAVTWTQPVDYQYDASNPARDLGGWNGGFHALLCDGSVRFLAQNINPQTLLNLMQCNDGKPIVDF